jgi:DNA-binding beta-propeller fold protein YncE
VAVDAHGNVYVADAFNNRVQKLSPTGQPLAQWGRPTIGFTHPAGVAIDSHGAVYVADTGNNRIAKFSPDGKLLGWRTGSQLQRPTGIAVDGAGDIYVADRQNGRVQKLSPSGKTLGRWGKGGSGLLQFSFRAQDHMNGVALDPHGNLYVADTANNRIKKLSPQGQTLAIWK